jgi:hypothetical protein
MEERNTNRNSNRENRQCQANRELRLERELLKESTRLDNADVWSLPYEKSIVIYLKQDEVYKKWKLLKGTREAREKINDKEDNEKQISKTSKKKH